MSYSTAVCDNQPKQTYESRLEDFVNRVSKHYSNPQQARDLIISIAQVCQSRADLPWSKLPARHQRAQIKSLIRSTAPYATYADPKSDNLDIKILTMIRRRLRERENYHSNFHRVYGALTTFYEKHGTLPTLDGFDYKILRSHLVDQNARKIKREFEERAQRHIQDVQDTARRKINAESIGHGI